MHQTDDAYSCPLYYQVWVDLGGVVRCKNVVLVELDLVQRAR
jgi:hypothetical protein